MSTTRDINMQEVVHFLYLSQGNTHIRSREGKPFLYDNGAFRIPNGVMPESALQRSRENTEIADGCLWWLGNRSVSREGATIIAALDSVFRAITNESPNGSPAELADSGVGVDEDSRGIKRKMTWLFPPAGDCANLSAAMGEKKIIYAIRKLSLDMWRGGQPSGGRLKLWGAQEAVNCQSMLEKLMANVETTQIMGRYLSASDIFSSEYRNLENNGRIACGDA